MCECSVFVSKNSRLAEDSLRPLNLELENVISVGKLFHFRSFQSIIPVLFFFVMLLCASSDEQFLPLLKQCAI